MEDVIKCEPPAPWLGGKSRLSDRIVDLIEGIPHDLYLEPFIGMGGVFFRRRRSVKCEVINDFNGEVSNLFRQLRRHHSTVLDEARFLLGSREEFERFKQQRPDLMTEIERAVRFLYLQHQAFGGKPSGQNFGVDRDRGSRFSIEKIETNISRIRKRLSQVIIENLDFIEVIDRYDRGTSLVYLDPPYYGGEGDYGKSLFSRARFIDLANRLSSLAGTFILSINDVPAIREVFSDFAMLEVQTKYTVQGGEAKSVGELLISNREAALVGAQKSLI